MTLSKNLARTAKSALALLGSRSAKAEKKGHWSHERSPEIPHSRLIPAATYSPWLSDTAFMAAYQRIRKFTLLDIYRCYELWDLARQSHRVDGAILEVGVFRGGSGCLLALAAPQKTVYLADTFEGVINAGPNDTRYLGGEHAETSDELVRGLLSSLKANNAHLLKGVFPRDTASSLRGPISMVHVDVDVYQSAKDTVEWALPRLGTGAAIVFDDYGFFGCEGVTRLVNELRGRLLDFAFFYNLNGHAVFVRTSNATPPVP